MLVSLLDIDKVTFVVEFVSLVAGCHRPRHEGREAIRSGSNRLNSIPRDVMIANAAQWFDQDGRLTEESIKLQIQKLLPGCADVTCKKICTVS